MPFVPVPKDLTKVKTKVAFNLTKRQLICFSLGGFVGVPVYLATKGGIGNDSAALLMIALMAPFFLFGIYEKDGQPLEKVLKNYISVKFLRPPGRPYKTENGYGMLARKEIFEKEVYGGNKTERKTKTDTALRGNTVPKRQKGIKRAAASERSEAERS